MFYFYSGRAIMDWTILSTGFLSYSIERMSRYLSLGFACFEIGSDIGLLLEAVDSYANFFISNKNYKVNYYFIFMVIKGNNPIKSDSKN
jgi:hypothetical protein